MKTLQNILSSKGNQIFSIGPADSVFDALEEMAQREVGALIVLDGGKVVGIFSERDYARMLVQRDGAESGEARSRFERADRIEAVLRSGARR